MAMENKRITQLSTERLTLTSGDYVMVDDADNGSAKYRLDRLKETDTTLSVSGKAADAAATGQAISEEAEARDNADNALDKDIGDLKSALQETVLSRNILVQPLNRLNLNAITDGKTLYSDGVLRNDSTMFVTDYIAVEEGDKVYCKYNGTLTMYRYALCAYNSSKQVIPSAGVDGSASGAYTVPTNVSYVRLTLGNADKTHTVVTINELASGYVAYEDPHYAISQDFLTNETADKIEREYENNYGCSLPNCDLRMTQGIAETWYKINAVTPPTEYANVSIGASYIEKYNDKFVFPNTLTLSSDIYFLWSAYNEKLIEIFNQGGDPTYGIGRKIVAENLSNCSLLAIGDSTVDQDTFTASMLSYFASKGKTLTLLGTLGDGSADNHNEGRAGWKATDYLTNKQYNGVVNPFYNPSTQTFDFAYYMTNQGYSAPNFVVLQLGINDLYYDYDSAIEATWSAIKTMIDSITNYNSSIKIILNLPTPPNTDQSKMYNIGFLYRNAVVRYNQYAIKKAKEFYPANKVRISYVHLILDPSVDISDDVHPKPAGYQKMALEVVNQINCWQNA